MGGGRRGAVAAGHPAEVRAGLWALEEGGNAVDAAVAGAFVAFVVEPNNAGLAGYGHLSAFLPDLGGFVTVDHGPRAPRRATAGMYEPLVTDALGPYDWPDVAGGANERGHLAVAVPGAVAGLHAIHERAGRLPFGRLLAPAIAAADQGVELTWNLLIEIHGRLAEIRTAPDLAGWLLRDGDPPRAAGQYGPGERLDGSALAQSLRLIAEHGPAAFYEGSIAAAIVAEMERGGGLIDAADLAGYAPKVIAETPARYRDVEYVTANDQVGYEALNIAARFPLAEHGPGSAEHHHILAEAVGHAFVDNQTYYGDPDHTESPVAGLASADFATHRAAGISLDRVAPRPLAAADPWPYQDGAARQPPPAGRGGTAGTTFVVAADASGAMVSLITTIGADFGSLVRVPGTGIVLNNSMMNYDPRPGRSNSIAPGKMPFFAVPAIVATRAGKAAFASAGAGGYRILSSVLHTTVNALEHGLDVQAAIDVPRSHGQGEETYIDAAVPPGVRDRLAALGHELVTEETTPAHAAFGRVGAVMVEADGELRAGSGPAWSSAAGAL